MFGNYRDKVWNGSLGEKEIISALAEGDSAKLIANRLGTSANTVSNQIVSARKKLRAMNNVQLVVKAITLDLLSGESRKG